MSNEAVRAIARIKYSQGASVSDNPYSSGTSEHTAFNHEISRCQVEELRNESRSVW